jgi:hypothetical protein
MLYSTSTRGFYPEEIQYQNPPADLIEVTDDDYKAAMTLAIGETLDVVNGKLVIVSSPLPSPDQLEVQFTAAIQHRLDDFALHLCHQHSAKIQSRRAGMRKPARYNMGSGLCRVDRCAGKQATHAVRYRRHRG